MDSPCIKQTVCKVLKIFQHGKYLVAYVLKYVSARDFGTYRLSEQQRLRQVCAYAFASRKHKVWIQIKHQIYNPTGCVSIRFYDGRFANMRWVPNSRVLVHIKYK